MTCKDQNLAEYPGFTCSGDATYEGCWQHFGKIESFDEHFILIDENQPMWPLDSWTDEEAKAHEAEWPSGNMRCATPEELKNMGLNVDKNLVWRTAEEEEIIRRLQEGLNKGEIKNSEDDALDN